MVEELCVGDLAMALDISMDQSSYALKQLKTAGLVQSRRDGRVMYYRLADGFPHQLLDHCLRQLLTIAKEARHDRTTHTTNRAPSTMEHAGTARWAASTTWPSAPRCTA